jgi:uncharacterized protein YceK
MRRTALALAFVTASLHGCGTMSNFSSKQPDRTQIYGGVLADLKSMEVWANHQVPAEDTGILHDVGYGVGLGLMGLDVPLSAIGDTLTLPITIPMVLLRPADGGTTSRKQAVAAGEKNDNAKETTGKPADNPDLRAAK